jgi:hypothetical protein
MPELTLTLEPDLYAVVRLEPDLSLPSWARLSDIFSITRTRDELCVVCLEAVIPQGLSAQFERGWRLLKLEGPFSFTLTGILVSVLDPLAAVGVGIFAFSTFDTDYVMVPGTKLETALAALRQAGHTIQPLEE